MFSDNRRISERQIKKLLIFDLFGIVTLKFPGILSRMCGQDGVFCIPVAGILMVLSMILFQRLLREMTGSYLEFLEQLFGGIIAGIIKIFYFFYTALLAGYGAYLCAGLIQSNLLSESPLELVLFLIFLLAVYGIWNGIETRARIYEFLFWFLMIPLFMMLVFTAKDIDTNRWTPVFMTKGGNIGIGIWSMICFLGIVFLIPFLNEFAVEKGAVIRGTKRAVIYITVLAAVIYEILVGIFGTESLPYREDPVIKLLSLVKLPGGFFQRQDAIMTGIWFFTLYAVVCTGLFYGSLTWKSIFDTKNGKPGIAGALVFAVTSAYGYYRVPELEDIYLKAVFFFFTPLLVFIPLIAGVIAERRRGGYGNKENRWGQEK